jgi:hypothetical protein
MKKSVVLVILFLFCFGCSRNKPSKYAIVYGIADYSNVEINLAYSANDAISVSRLLEKYGYTVILRTDTTATIKNLEADFSTMAGIVDDNDLFMFYFSGHGLSKQTLLDFGDSTAPDDYFAMLLNHQFTYSNMLDYIKENSVSNGKLTQLMSRISKGIKIAVIDACYSGGAITNRPVVDYSPDDFNGHYGDDPDLKTILDDAGHIYKTNVLGRNGTDPGYMILSSCGRNEISWDGFFLAQRFFVFLFKGRRAGRYKRRWSDNGVGNLFLYQRSLEKILEYPYAKCRLELSSKNHR